MEIETAMLQLFDEARVTRLALLRRIKDAAPEMTGSEAAAAYKTLTELDIADEMASKAVG